ncbi:YbaB/EbfC family nucleoid-associated protein [Actinoplanes sp. NPDC051851]|uniref:YbaB/EbfC family nucleoid-associated protein n=1 Tax=Actinoplanes sp. NPDC051851 TaxID=3154753 RepID=UPI00342FC5C2
MTTTPDPSGITRMLADVTAALGTFQAGGGSPSGEEREPITGTGEALDGAIVVTAEVPGRITGLEFRPAVMRMDSAALAEETMAAVNAALTDLRERVGAAATPGVSFDALSGQLKEIQQTATQRLTAFTESLAEAQARISEQGRR